MVFAVVLIIVELGWFVGLTKATSAVIDHSQVDLWITPSHVPYPGTGRPLE